jgi:hypothetical protein
MNLGDRPSSTFGKNFYQLSFTPPIFGHLIGPSIGIRASYKFLVILTSLRSKDGVPGTGSGPPHFDGTNYQMWQRRMAAFLRGKGQILWDVTVNIL